MESELEPSSAAIFHQKEIKKHSAERAGSSYRMFLLVGELYPLSRGEPTKPWAINHARWN